MNKNLPNKIVIISLCEKFSNEIAKMISQDLGMLFCNARELIEYELIDRKRVEEIASVKYVKDVEKKVLKNLASYENVCISLSYEYFMTSYKSFENNSLIIFLDLPKNFIKENEMVSFLDYDERKKNLSKLSACLVSVRKLDKNFVKDKVLKILGGIL